MNGESKSALDIPIVKALAGIRPNPKQVKFFSARSRFVAYGGARGGGKSWALQIKAVLLAVNYPGIRVLIVRRTYPELRDNHIRKLSSLTVGAAHYKDAEKCLEFTAKDGKISLVYFGYCDAESDVLRYQGQEYDVIMIDEATQLTEYQFETFKACCRGANDFPRRIYLTCNPGGVGHEWVKRLFIDRKYKPDERADDYTFIPATVHDNKQLLDADPGYVQMLESLPTGGLREAWLEGRWDVFAGQYFPEFDRAIHICEPFQVPEHWRKYVTLDYGFDMLAAYLIAVDEHKCAYVLRECYDGRDIGDGHTGLIVSEAAERVRDMAEGSNVTAYLAPPDLWSRRQETGRSVSDIFAEHGIILTQTSNDRVAGWTALKEWLAPYSDEQGIRTARLRIFPKCVNLLRCIPALQYDEKRPNDVATEPHEITHAPDALRGFAVYWTNQASPAPPPKSPQRWPEDWWEDWYNADEATRQEIIKRRGMPR